MAPRLNPLHGIRSAQGAVCDNRISTDRTLVVDQERACLAVKLVGGVAD